MPRKSHHDRPLSGVGHTRSYLAKRKFVGITSFHVAPPNHSQPLTLSAFSGSMIYHSRLTSLSHLELSHENLLEIVAALPVGF